MTTDIELGSGPTGCFLIHGFTGSTYELAGLAGFLADQGYHVSARLLPGHGTTMRECNLVRAEDWLEETELRFTEFMLNHHTTFVIGLSMGAGLALHLGALFPVGGVVAISTALYLESWRTRIQLPLLAPFVEAIPKSNVYSPEGLERHPYYGYPGYPVKALRQVLRLNARIRKELPEVQAPVLLMHSRADQTANFNNAAKVLAQLGDTPKKLVEFQESSHVMTDGSEKEAVWQAIDEFINETV
ncbi:MAG: alpha/beta fold hydrolase [Candidatus Marinimicrobia bacterium]|nr:alpha/beta fold hydrolase [Candidatus Neomarinimicrobiota bacterium]